MTPPTLVARLREMATEIEQATAECLEAHEKEQAQLLADGDPDAPMAPYCHICKAEAPYAAGMREAADTLEAREQGRRACNCTDPDPVMQADRKFYCQTCSFETGARPNNLEPERWYRQAMEADALLMDQLSAQAWCQGVRPHIEAQNADEFVSRILRALRDESKHASEAKEQEHEKELAKARTEGIGVGRLGGDVLVAEMRHRFQQELESVNARFCDEHRGIYRTSGCLVCGSAKTATEREAAQLDLSTAQAERDAAQKAMSYSSEQAHLEWTRANKAESELADAQAEIARLREALDLIANGKKGGMMAGGPDLKGYQMRDVARAALASAPTETQP